MLTRAPDDAKSGEFISWRRLYFKQLTLGVLAVSALGVCAPLINLYADPHTTAYWLVAAVVPTLVLVRGARAMLFPAERPNIRWPLYCGPLSAVLFVLVAFESVPAAARNFIFHPSWIFLSTLGSMAILIYLVAAVRYWPGKKVVT